MYPNSEDVRQALPKLPGAPSVESVFEDCVFARSVLFEANQVCYSHGRHQQTPVNELLKFVEQVVSRPISAWAFVAALRLLGLKSNPPMLNPNELTKAKVKFPPFERFPFELWREQCVSALNQEIDAEKVQTARFAH